VLAAIEAAGLAVTEWYVRGPSSPTEAKTNRLYVLAQGPASTL
jgi:hypothetical protein